MTRQQMVVIMDRTAGKVLNENTITEKETLDKIQGKIADYDTICDAYKESVVQAYGKGLMEVYLLQLRQLQEQKQPL